MTEMGHNQPPELTPFEKADQEIETLYLEAQNWLDGNAIENQAQADTLSDLLNQLRQARKDADGARKKEKAPHLEAGKAVDAKYKPLLTKADNATAAAKKALAPWLQKLEQEKREAEARARKEAEEAERAAREAREEATQSANLEEREAVEALEKRAEQARRSAKKVSNQKVQLSGGAGRAVGLRDNWTAKVVNLRSVVGHYWATDREEFQALAQRLADRDVRAGKREIPGVEIKNERIAV